MATYFSNHSFSTFLNPWALTKVFVEQTPAPPYGGVERLFSLLTASVKTDLELEIQFLLKCSFLTVFSKIYCPTNVDVLGT